MPKSLDLDRLKRFEPERRTIEANEHSAAREAQLERWPSREPVAEGQISIKGSMTTIRRFKILCKEDRRTYADMLDILMNSFESKT